MAAQTAQGSVQPQPVAKFKVGIFLLFSGIELLAIHAEDWISCIGYVSWCSKMSLYIFSLFSSAMVELEKRLS